MITESHKLPRKNLYPQILEVHTSEIGDIVWDIEDAPEMNIPLFKGIRAFMVNAESVVNGEINNSLVTVEPETRLVFEIAQGQFFSDYKELQSLLDMQLISVYKRAELDRMCIDPEDGTIATVTHFYAPIQVQAERLRNSQNMKDAYREAINDGAWSKYESKSVEYANGTDITPELVREIWDCYDETFDKLVERHPSAQKEPFEYFVQQLLLPTSSVVYIRDRSGRIASVAFCVEDSRDCPWLNPDFFEDKNPEGRTAFFPGIATRLDAKGAMYSASLVGAFSELVARTGTITGLATQCTNRSKHYIPKIMERYSRPNLIFKLEATEEIEYPVFVIKKQASIGGIAIDGSV